MADIFDTETDFENALIPATTNSVVIMGYYSPGDGGGHQKVRIPPPATVQPWHKQSADGAWWDLSVAVADIRMFGARGDYETDDTAARDNWLAYFAATKTPLTATAGNYRCTDTMVWPEGVMIDGGNPLRAASFPQYDGWDKSNIRPGFKHLVTGANFWFEGNPTLGYSTARSDKFSSMSPCVLYDHFAPFQVRGIGIIQNMDVYTAAGALTTAANDNRASAYTAGIVNRSTLSILENVTVFGYFSGAGVVHVNVLGDGPGGANDPDYSIYDNCLITGGVAIIGGDSETPISEGNTGTHWNCCGLYGADHHTRADTDPALLGCLYIDLALTTSQQGRGHTFNNVQFRTCIDNAINLDHCNDIILTGFVTEFSEVPGVPGLSQRGEIKGTANTQNVALLGGAATGHLGLASLRHAISGRLEVKGVAGASLGGFSNPQFETIVRSASLTVSANSIQPFGRYHLISSAGNPNITSMDVSLLKDGDMVRFRRSGSGAITFTSGSNIALGVGVATLVLNSAADVIEFEKQGSNMWLYNYQNLA